MKANETRKRSPATCNSLTPVASWLDWSIRSASPPTGLSFATGFDFLTDYSREAGMQVIGPGGRPLSEHWADGPRTLYGFMTQGFPNFFTMSIAQAGAAVNYVHMADEQTKTIVQVITESMRRGVQTVQPALDAENAWVELVVSGARGRRAFLEACTPGYYNYEGRRERSAALNDFYAPGPTAYAQLLDDWRGKPDLPGLEMTFEPRSEAGS